MAEHPLLATYTERLRLKWDAEFVSKSRRGQPFAQYKDCGTNAPRACIITASGRTLTLPANSDVSNLIKAVDEATKHSGHSILVIEDINTNWAANLGVAWARDDQDLVDEQFWVTHASNPRRRTGRGLWSCMYEGSMIWSLPGDAVSEEFHIHGRDPLQVLLHRLEDGRKTEKWWTIAGVYEWMRFDDNIDPDTTSHNNFPRRKEVDGSYLNMNTNISYYRIKSDLCKHSSISIIMMLLLIRFNRFVSC
jgi:hypothetical protein